MATLFAGNNGGIDLSTFDLEAITTGIPTTKTASDYVLPAAEFKGLFSNTPTSFTPTP